MNRSPELNADVRRALERWPDVPAAYGWLRLDRRGRWWLGGGLLEHPRASAFLHSHYGADERGAWYVQNGPQRAYVSLDLAPLVFSLDGRGELQTPAGRPVGAPRELVVTDSGELLLETALGLGNVLDRDLTAFIARLTVEGHASGVEEVLAGRAKGTLGFGVHRLSVWHGPAAALPARYGFLPEPEPA